MAVLFHSILFFHTFCFIPLSSLPLCFVTKMPKKKKKKKQDTGFEPMFPLAFCFFLPFFCQSVPDNSPSSQKYLDHFKFP